MKTKKLVITALFAAIICLIAPVSVKIGIIPMSLASFAVYLIASMANWQISLSAVTIYILLGAFGVPVFAGYNGGFNVIIGLTGGYIIGYLPCALCTSLFCKKFSSKLFMYPCGMILGTVLLYGIGTAWYMALSGNSFSTAFASCVAPFLVFDAIKIAAASLAGFLVRSRLPQKLLEGIC